MLLFTADLDNTLIYSYKYACLGPCVETKEGKSLSYMTPIAAALLQRVAACTEFVPVTTRSLEQYQRIRLLTEGYPRYALTGNGATLLVDHQVDEEWQQGTANLIADSRHELQQALWLLAQDPAITLAARLVDDAFVYGKTADVAGSIARLGAQLDLSQVTIDHNGEKLYVLPKALTKGVAVKRLKVRLAQSQVIAAGDSYFDQSMLAEADVALIPQDSVLAEALADHPQLAISTLPGCQFAEFVLQKVLDQVAQR